jgi:hypothetical protein
MDLFLRARHYWTNVGYNSFAQLQTDGSLQQVALDESHDGTFSFFNIDMIYSWVFAPASELSVVYKLAADESIDNRDRTYRGSISDIGQLPQNSSVSIRVLYFLDYLMLKKNRLRKREAAAQASAANRNFEGYRSYRTMGR